MVRISEIINEPDVGLQVNRRKVIDDTPTVRPTTTTGHAERNESVQSTTKQKWDEAGRFSRFPEWKQSAVTAPQKPKTKAAADAPESAFLISHTADEKMKEKRAKQSERQRVVVSETADGGGDKSTMKDYLKNFLASETDRQKTARGTERPAARRHAVEKPEALAKTEETREDSGDSDDEDEPFTPAPIPQQRPVVATKKQWVDITPNKDGGILKGVRKEGYGPFCPSRYGKKGDTVYVHYTGRVKKTDKVFRTTKRETKEFAFTLGNAMVAMREDDYKYSTKDLIRFWDLAAQTMKKGEKATFVVKAHYAYGKEGLPHKAKGEEPWVPPNATLIFDVELVRWEGEDLTTNMEKSITKSKIVIGEEYGRVNVGGTVEAHLIGWYEDRIFMDKVMEWECGEAFDLGLPKGVDEAVQQMTKNERSWVQMKCEWAYGSKAKKEYGLPRYADLDFDITLLHQQRAPETTDMDKEERIDYAEKMKKRGSEWFQKGNYKLALKKFDKLWEVISDEKEMKNYEGVDISMGGADWSYHTQKTQRDELWQAAHLNLAFCYLKLSKHAKALDHCERLLRQFPVNAKAHYRKGLCLQAKKEYAEAVQCFKEVLSIEADNEPAKQQIRLCCKQDKADRAKQMSTYGRFFTDKQGARVDEDESDQEAKAKSQMRKKEPPPGLKRGFPQFIPEGYQRDHYTWGK